MNTTNETSQALTTGNGRNAAAIGGRGIQLQNMDDLARFGDWVSKSGLAPKGMQTPQAIAVAIQLGLELGLTPMAALQNIASINGRPSIYGDAALALVRASGLLESYSEEEVGAPGTDDFGVKVTSKRRDFGTLSNTFTVGQAKRAKLWGKQGPWTEYPERMLKWRARGFNLRDNFGDILKGLHTVEEARDMPRERTEVTVSEPAFTPRQVNPPTAENAPEPKQEPAPTVTEAEAELVDVELSFPDTVRAQLTAEAVTEPEFIEVCKRQKRCGKKVVRLEEFSEANLKQAFDALPDICAQARAEKSEVTP